MLSAVLIEVDVAGVERDAGVASLHDHIVWEDADHAQAFADRFGPGSSPAAGASVVRCEMREVAAAV